MIGKFQIAASFAVIYVYAGELMPTVVRSEAMGISSFVAGIGLLIFPYINSLVRLIFSSFSKKCENVFFLNDFKFHFKLHIHFLIIIGQLQPRTSSCNNGIPIGHGRYHCVVSARNLVDSFTKHFGRERVFWISFQYL